MNLAGAFRGLGVGLTQAGQYGLQQQAEARKDQVLMDREQALARLQGERSHQDIVDRARADIVVNSAKVEDETNAKKDLLPGQTAAQITVDKARINAQTQAEYDSLPAKIKLQMTVEQYRQAQETARAKMSNDASMQRTQYEVGHQDARSAADRAAHVEYQGTNDTGDLVIGHGDGGVSTVEGVKPKATVDLFGGMGGLPTAAGGAATPTPSTPRPIKVTTQAPGGGDAAASSKPPNTYTMSDLTYTATRYGITTDEARRRLNAAGYRLTN